MGFFVGLLKSCTFILNLNHTDMPDPIPNDPKKPPYPEADAVEVNETPVQEEESQEEEE